MIDPAADAAASAALAPIVDKLVHAPLKPVPRVQPEPKGFYRGARIRPR